MELHPLWTGQRGNMLDELCHNLLLQSDSQKASWTSANERHVLTNRRKAGLDLQAESAKPALHYHTKPISQQTTGRISLSTHA